MDDSELTMDGQYLVNALEHVATAIELNALAQMALACHVGKPNPGELGRLIDELRRECAFSREFREYG